MKKAATFGVLAIGLLLALAACGAQPTEAPTEPPATEIPEPSPLPPTPTEVEWSPPEGALVSEPVDQAPTLDGSADEPFWADAPSVTIPVSGGANNGSTEVSLRSVYSGDRVYFLAVWADPTESYLRAPWVMQEDGSWAHLSDPNDRGGDNNAYYEDKLALIWPINDSIPEFSSLGCFTACHAGENPENKPYGNKYTAEQGQTADIWHWKSVRNSGQVDDQYLDSTRYSADTPEAGRHSDPNDGGGYHNNETEDKSLPAFMPPNGGARGGSPGYILEAEAVPFDPSLFSPGDMIPGIITAPYQGDRGDISAGWVWADGMWILEFGRDLVTGSEFDVQFDDLTATYYFGVAAFDNAQVRHTFETGATPFVFQP